MLATEKSLKIFTLSKLDDPSFYENLKCDFFDGHDETKFGLYGTLSKEKDIYSRIDEKDLLSFIPVNENLRWLGMNSSGIQLRFSTNSRVIKLRVRENNNWEIYNMTFYSQNGFDLYYYDEEERKWKFHNVSTPEYFDKKTYKSTIGRFKDKKIRMFILNFPTYSAVEKLEIGLEKNSIVTPIYYKDNSKIVCYGTSIIQGGATSRPGLITTNTLSRILDKQIINLGFSGNAFLEKEMANIIASIDKMELLIIDPEANAGYDSRLKDNLEQFLDIIFDKNPNLKVLISNKTYMSLDDVYPLYKKSKKYSP